MRKTFRNKDNFKYWKNRWDSIDADLPMKDIKSYPLKYSNLVVKYKKHKILEAGCGGGRILRYYHNLGYNIIGIDFISSVIKKLKNQDPSLNVKADNILNLSFKDEYFDIILAFGLFHNFHSKKLIKSLKESHRVLKKNGKICASFRADNLQELIVDLLNKDKLNKNKKFHKLNLKKKEFINLLEDNGFKVLKIFSVQNMPFLYKFRIFRRYDHKKFNENLARIHGYKLSLIGQILQNFLIRLFPNNFCNVYLAIAKKY